MTLVPMDPTQLSEIDNELVEFNRIRLKEEVSEGISNLMRAAKVSRSRLADLLGVTRARVSHMLSGAQNFRLDSLADVFLVLGRAPHFTLGVDLDEYRDPIDEATFAVYYPPTQFIAIDIYGEAEERTQQSDIGRTGQFRIGDPGTGFRPRDKVEGAVPGEYEFVNFMDRYREIDATR